MSHKLVLLLAVLGLCSILLPFTLVDGRLTLSGHSARNPAHSPPSGNAQFLYPRANKIFKTHGAAHVEPLLHFRVTHEDNHHLHTVENSLPDSNHPLKQNAANSLAAHSTKMRFRNGHEQPFPDSISVAFRLWDEEFAFNHMQLDTKLFAEDAKMEVTNPDGSVTYHPHTLNTYISELSFDDSDSKGWAVVTLAKDGLMTATINMGDDTIQVNPVFVHSHEMDEETHADLLKHTPHGMVAVKHSDMVHLKEGKHQCGVVQPKGPKDGEAAQPEEINPDDIQWDSLGNHTLVDDDNGSVSSSRRLLAYPPGYGVTRYTNCYTGDSTAHKLSMGVAVDYGFYAIYGSTAAVQNAIANVFASVNAVYLAQMNMFHEITSTVIKAAADSTAWNRSPATRGGRCDSVTINTDLNDFTSWRSSTYPKTNGLWHLLTACYPAPGTVGLAWLGVLCSSTYGTGVSSYTGSLWLTVAHEIGHNYNAPHAFDEGQGTTGGIMDYGDGIYPLNSGIYQFNPKYAQTQMCASIQKITTTTGFTPYCFANYAPSCGNGVVEQGEECDDSSSCCSNCRLVGQCTKGPTGLNECCTSSCTFAPSTTTCASNTGYCGNGQCVSSICSGYGLSFCGMSANGCKQKCQSGSSCTDNWVAPNCNIPSGTVCATSPYSTCSGSGACVASTPAVTYSWSSVQSACSCSGTYTATVTCKGSDGSTASDASCSSTTKPPTSGTCAAPSSCYSWQQSAWSACSVDCGTGTQTSSVNCVVSGGGVVSASQCTTAAPATQRTCTQAACPTKWKVSGFGSCTVSCGGGTQTQTVQCVQTQNGLESVVSDSSCAGTKPLTSQSCNTTPCQDGQWSYGAWSACSVECGGGVQTRTQACVSPSGTAYPDFSRCGNAGTPLPTSQPCNTRKCPIYAWSAGTWGTCSVSCGGGTQTRTVNCYDDANDPSHTIIQNVNLCTTSKPASIQTCNTAACPVPPNYQWQTSSWGACSVTCGGGTSTRTVTCINAVDNTVVQSNLCSDATKPATSQSCSQQGCPTYSWVASGWSSCSLSCGGGVQTQTVVCKQDGTTATVADSFCKTTKPSTSQACNTASCPPPPPTIPPHTWVQGTGSPCSKQCNGGTQTFSPQCYRTDVTPNTVIAVENCSDLPKPPTQTACNTQVCPTYWYTGSWGTCSASCGAGGVQTRTVSCFYSTDDPLKATPLADSKCTASKPATQSSCNTFACPTWQYSGPWSKCSQPCNVGIQTRNVTCTNFDGTLAPSSACAKAMQLPVQQTCVIIPCPHWHRNIWTDCSKPCADASGPGNQTREVICRMPHDDPLYYGIEAKDPTLCSETSGDTGDGDGSAGVAFGKPSSSQSCNQDACPQYYWYQAEPGPCSKPCGKGTRTSKVVCMNARTSQPALSSQLCLGEPPKSTFDCNDFDCPEYLWATGNWTDCNAECDSGTQARSIACRNVKPDPSIHYKYVDVDHSYCLAISLPPPNTQVCTLPATTCYGWSNSTTTSSPKNGRCDLTTKRCTCRTGYSGSTCNDFAAITEVATNGQLFGSTGMPFGQPLQITWSSSTKDIPYVDVLLSRRTSAGVNNFPVGQYLASHIPNTNSWTWAIGSILSTGIEAGDGYFVRVWYSRNSYADSPTFTIADPCAYISCGAYGTCSNGHCQCAPGYTGDLCTVGPCERATCAPSTSSCNNTDVIASGAYAKSDSVCTCQAGYSGPQCRTPSCIDDSLKCLNGGDMQNVVLSSDACTGQCVCRDAWSGPTCAKCSLTCANGGVPSKDCTACEKCKDGFFGKQCQCQYYIIEYRLTADITDWYNTNNEVARTRWMKTLSLDIQSALATVSSLKTLITVENVQPLPDGKTQARVRFSLDCVSSSAMSPFENAISGESSFDYMAYEPQHDTYTESAYLAQLAGRLGKKIEQLTKEDIASDGSLNRDLFLASVRPSAHARRLFQQSSTGSLLDAYNAYLPLLSDRDSPAWQGQLTSQMDVSFTVVATDPSGISALAQPNAPLDCFENDCTQQSSGTDDEDSSKSVIETITSNSLYLALFIVGIVVVLVLIGVAIFFFVRRSRQGKDTSSHISRMTTSGDQEMTTNPALAAINNSGRWDPSQI